MPKPNKNNPQCPRCLGTHYLSKNGRQVSGALQYRCQFCGYTKTDSDRSPGKPRLGALPLSPQEIYQRYRLKKQINK